MTFSWMSAREMDIVRRLHKEGINVTVIAKATKRARSTIHRLLQTPHKRKAGKPGPTPALSKKDVNKLVQTTKRLVKQAQGEYEVSLSIIAQDCKCKASLRTVRKALHSKGIRFYRMRQKPVLKTEDRKARMEFARKYKNKSRAWWIENLHLAIDNKNFPIYYHAEARRHAANRLIRGAYRCKADGLDEAYVQVPKHMKYNPGMKSAIIAAGVGEGKVRMWHVLDKKWSGAEAAKLYRGPVRAALVKANGTRRFHTVLEDNDRTGFKSALGKAAKVASKIKVLEIPKRSPDLNPCDFSLWSIVNRRMRKQERKFAKSKKETRKQFLARLRRTATRLPKKIIDGMIGDMARRVRRLFQCKGGLIEEGGASKM